MLIMRKFKLEFTKAISLSMKRGNSLSLPISKIGRDHPCLSQHITNTPQVQGFNPQLTIVDQKAYEKVK